MTTYALYPKISQRTKKTNAYSGDGGYVTKLQEFRSSFDSLVKAFSVIRIIPQNSIQDIIAKLKSQKRLGEEIIRTSSRLNSKRTDSLKAKINNFWSSYENIKLSFDYEARGQRTKLKNLSIRQFNTLKGNMQNAIDIANSNMYYNYLSPVKKQRGAADSDENMYTIVASLLDRIEDCESDMKIFYDALQANDDENNDASNTSFNNYDWNEDFTEIFNFLKSNEESTNNFFQTNELFSQQNKTIQSAVAQNFSMIRRHFSDLKELNNVMQNINDTVQRTKVEISRLIPYSGNRGIQSTPSKNSLVQRKIMQEKTKSPKRTESILLSPNNPRISNRTKPTVDLKPKVLKSGVRRQNATQKNAAEPQNECFNTFFADSPGKVDQNELNDEYESDDNQNTSIDYSYSPAKIKQNTSNDFSYSPKKVKQNTSKDFSYSPTKIKQNTSNDFSYSPKKVKQNTSNDFNNEYQNKAKAKADELLNDLRNRIKVSKESVKALNEEIKKSAKTLDKENEALVKQKLHLSKKKREIESVEAELERLTSDVSALEEEHASLLQQKNELQSQKAKGRVLNETQRNIASAKDEFEYYIAENDSLKEALKNNKDELAAQLERHESQRIELADILNRFRKSAKNQSKSVNNYEKYEELSNELISLQNEAFRSQKLYIQLCAVQYRVNHYVPLQSITGTGSSARRRNQLDKELKSIESEYDKIVGEKMRFIDERYFLMQKVRSRDEALLSELSRVRSTFDEKQKIFIPQYNRSQKLEWKRTEMKFDSRLYKLRRKTVETIDSIRRKGDNYDDFTKECVEEANEETELIKKENERMKKRCFSHANWLSNLNDSVIKENARKIALEYKLRSIRSKLQNPTFDENSILTDTYNSLVREISQLDNILSSASLNFIKLTSMMSNS